MSSNQSTIGSPNTSDDQTLQTIDTIFKTAIAVAPVGDTVALLAGADSEDVAVGTKAVVAAMPGIEALIDGLFSIFHHKKAPAQAAKPTVAGPAAGG